VSPTVIRFGPYRLFFFSREEARMHVHIQSADGEAKFWIEPTVTLANQVGFSKKQLNELHKLVEENRHVIRDAWQKHFGSDEH
jgi:Domain of unknown function (DUF4160)